MQSRLLEEALTGLVKYILHVALMERVYHSDDRSPVAGMFERGSCSRHLITPILALD